MLKNAEGKAQNLFDFSFFASPSAFRSGFWRLFMAKVETRRILKMAPDLSVDRIVKHPIAAGSPITPAQSSKSMPQIRDLIDPHVEREINAIIREQRGERDRKAAMREAREMLEERLGMNHDEAFAFIGIYGSGMVSDLVKWFESVYSSFSYHQITLMILDAIAKERHGYIDIRLPDPPFVGEWKKILMAIIFICESFAPKQVNFSAMKNARPTAEA